MGSQRCITYTKTRSGAIIRHQLNIRECEYIIRSSNEILPKMDNEKQSLAYQTVMDMVA